MNEMRCPRCEALKRAYLNLWDWLLRPFDRCAWFNPNYTLLVQIEHAHEQ